ncbi:MAG: hypothetical protein EXR66_07315 [Dehalococcoidia bacterium]|nr:hypothetical protein [Dehalococcoidia bacterium]
MERGMLPTVLVTLGGTVTGFVLSVFVFDTDMPVVASLLGTGGGTMIGAYIAAIATNEPLLGGSSTRREALRPGRRTEADD